MLSMNVFLQIPGNPLQIFATNFSILHSFFFRQLCYIKKKGGMVLAKYSSKINKIRTFALSLIFAGFIVMYTGLFFRAHPVVVTLFMLFGLFFILLSTVVYFWIGMLSTKAVQVICPGCGKPTKMLGRVDICMHCNEPLTLDPELEGKAFDESYNRKRLQK